jgi:hypothetical protein
MVIGRARVQAAYVERVSENCALIELSRKAVSYGRLLTAVYYNKVYGPSFNAAENKEGGDQNISSYLGVWNQMADLHS